MVSALVCEVDGVVSIDCCRCASFIVVGKTRGRVPLSTIEKQMTWLNDAFAGRGSDVLAVDSGIRFVLASVSYHRSEY